MTEHKYRVIKRLEAGGMAEVFVGEAVSVQGFKKRVAIKRVLPHLAQNDSFIQMFLDEARLSARLNHANIVSVFDISARDDTYFLIMEFVDGANLKRIMDYLQRQGRRFPLAEAAFICMEACRGLSYAHELADESGEALHIVHRDISPPNILVTKRGEVKVADFGLAKAGTQIAQTDPGVVKGKFSYLSPEAAQGEEVDARSDIFSLGIVLWEMLAGRRLFLGDSDYATVKLVQNANVPRLSPLNGQVDEAFEELLLRALARDASHRFQSAREFGDALAGYLLHRQLKVTPHDIATLVVRATSKPSSERPIVNENSLIDRLIQEELNESVAIAEGATSRPAPAPRNSRSPAGELEDPASWFSDDELNIPADAPALSAREDAAGPERAPGSWRESGLESMALLESEPPTGDHPRPANEAPAAAHAIAPAAPAPPTTTRQAPPAPPSLATPTLDNRGGAAAAEKTGGGSRLLIAAVVLAAIAAGAAAFFGAQL